MSSDAPLPENTGLEAWYPTQEARAHFKPTDEQRERLKYWDFFVYWVEFALRRQHGGEMPDPGYRRNR